MTMQLYLTYGSTTIDFQDDEYKLLDPFAPEVPSDPELADDPSFTLTERFDVRIDGDDDEREAGLRAIRQAFNYARTHQNGSVGCWLYFAIDQDSVAWRARVIDGVVMHRQTVDRDWRRSFVVVTVVVERRGYWEGPRTQIPISNTNGTNNTAGLNIYNCNDGSGASPNDRVNYADIADDDVIGDMRSPAELLIVNNYNESENLYDVWIGHNHTNPATTVWNYEAEDANGATPAVNASASDGNIVEHVLSSSLEVSLLTWTLSAVQLSAYMGQYVHAMVRFHNGSIILPEIKFRIKLQWNAITIWETDQVMPSDLRAITIRDLFTFRLPPWLQNVGSLDSVNLILTGQRTGEVSRTIYTDFLMLVPADSFRHLTHIGYGTAYTDRIVDDGPSDEVYRDDAAGAERVGVVTKWGGPILLEPGKDQRLYFLMHSDTLYTAEVARSISLKVYYRPRRTSL